MSYGYHRLGANVDPAKAKAKMGRIMAKLFGHKGGVHLTGGPILLKEGEIAAILPPGAPLEPPKVADTLLPDARAQGYTGNTCDQCGGGRMIRAGHCEACSDCGTTTGCS